MHKNEDKAMKYFLFHSRETFFIRILFFLLSVFFSHYTGSESLFYFSPCDPLEGELFADDVDGRHVPLLEQLAQVELHHQDHTVHAEHLVRLAQLHACLHNCQRQGKYRYRCIYYL
jgi:hypothetical protein